VLALLACAASLGAGATASAEPAAGAEPVAGVRAAGTPALRSSVLVLLLAAGERQLARAGLSVGIVSAAQGPYDRLQFLLDVTQGARVSPSAYPGGRPGPLLLREAGAGGVLEGWPAVRARAEAAPGLLEPGLLAAATPGGAAYAGIAGSDELDGVLAADRTGRIAQLSLGSAATLLARIAALRRERRVVVADLPAGSAGVTDLRALSAARGRGELLIALQRATGGAGGELLWGAIGGLAGGGERELRSQSTNERGLITASDIAPTALEHLGVRVPGAMDGRPVVTDGPLHTGALRSLMGRLRVIADRRLIALGLLLGGWALLLLALARRPRGRAWASRVGAIGVLWAPAVALIPAALAPSVGVEYATIVLGCLALGAISDRLLPWPRAALAPAVVGVLALTLDALAGTQLLMRSLVGPDPISGVRFYGIGNELKSALAVLVLAAVAGALYPAVRGRRAVGATAAAGAALAVAEGSARIGAGVGGVILVSVGFAVACALLLPGALTRRRALLVLLTPLAALLALAALDLASAHGGGHFTGTVLHARSAGQLRDVLVRRYGASWRELTGLPMLLASALALLCAALGVWRSERLLAPVGGDPAWSAACAGGLAAGIVGALVEDSGGLPLVVAVFTLACVTGYLHGRPPAPTGAGSLPAAVAAGPVEHDLVL